MTRGVKIVEIRKRISKNFEGKRKVHDIVEEKYMKKDFVCRKYKRN